MDPGPTCDLELKDHLCPGVFGSFLKSSTFGFKISHAKMINAEEEISNKNFWVLSARARARARAHGAFPRGWAPTALVHKEV